MLSTVDAELAWELFEKFCYVPLGTCVAPFFEKKDGEEGLSIEGVVDVKMGDVALVTLDGEYEISPGSQGNLGAGRGKSVTAELQGDVVMDARGRPIGE